MVLFIVDYDYFIFFIAACGAMRKRGKLKVEVRERFILGWKIFSKISPTKIFH